ncbi:sigma 54-interacting transcriptional regulator [Mucilaginibacter conchicola]|nr:sigma 54-interacting transcriptional regulator [Mucilaginibacter conchicola]
MTESLNISNPSVNEPASWLSDTMDRLESLSSFTRALAGIQSAAELYQLMKTLVSPALGTKDFAIFSLLPETGTLYNLLSEEDGLPASAVFRSSVSLVQTPLDRENLPDKDRQWPFDLDEVIAAQNAVPFLKPGNGADRHLCHLFELRNGAELTGLCIFIFNNTKTGISGHTASLQLLFDQISLAVSRIIINKKVQKQQEERELLLAVSTSIAKVKDHAQLHEALTKRLKNYFSFSHIAIAMNDENRKTFNLFLLDPLSKSRNHPDYERLRSKSYELNDQFVKTISTSPYPVSIDLQSYTAEELPLYLRINRESGIKMIWGLAFRTEERTIGILTFFFEEPRQLTANLMALMTGIGHLASVAVSNVMALQQVNKLLSFKSTMLSFGIELRMTKDKRALSRIIKKQIAELLEVKGFAILLISADQATGELFFYDHEQPVTVTAAFAEMAERPVPLNSDFYNEILKSSAPVRFPNDSLNSNVLEQLLSLAAEDVLVGTTIKLGDKIAGIMVMNCSDMRIISRDRQIFDSFCSQIGIVITNIQAHKDLEAQLKETEKYRQQLEVEKKYLAEEINILHNTSEIIGESSSLKGVYHLVSQVAKSSSTVLILGETGTGKELFARAIHNNSPRKDKVMIKVNCAAIPANLIESELFGHEKGSFTGATERRLGKFELASGSTLFLDEVGEMPLDLQVKLLRALQEKEIERVGGRTTIGVDVRIVAATNRNLEEEMAAGRFRRDLYYRLNIFPIDLPPLRQRRDDIEMLVKHFIEKYSKRCGKQITGIGPKALEDLKRYGWPGNIRELEHMIERSILLASDNTIRHIPLPVVKDDSVNIPDEEAQFALKTIDENEREHILNVLNYCAGRIAGKGNAADILGVPPTTLNSKMKRLGIRRGHTS